MSIQDRIRELVAEEKLTLLPPFPKRLQAKRHVFLTPLLYKRLHRSLGGDTDEDAHMAITLALLREFTAGKRITVCDNPRAKKKTARIARVDPRRLEMFDFRCMDPVPGTRLFGAFAEPDTFIGIHCWLKSHLHNGNFASAVRQARNDWDQRIGPTYPPFTSAKITDYLTNVMVV